ncbi:hypothetical protein [Bosea sp. (in: a-proteobacteria)]|uniref:hypothetical protein n=1 Tax=Bosea sp. (in: a-proteobacteria) TaxID=1871050 RepID=UPI00273530C1|nr:hypothetical protein [Bosea sp. (in: a-proteobacteria)]MDP3410362.1 hypothetical protein [Bosea sp. (in: a-proteobacteria)]
MKYRDLEAVADWGDHFPQRAAPDMNVIAFRHWPASQGRPRLHISQDRASNAPVTAAPEPARARAPASRLSWIERLAMDFGIAGNALAFGSTFEPYPPQPVPTRAKAVLPRRSTLSGRLRASVAGVYHGFLREMAVRRAVQDLRRLNAAMLRDIGIFDATAIEFFVRHGGER